MCGFLKISSKLSSVCNWLHKAKFQPTRRSCLEKRLWFLLQPTQKGHKKASCINSSDSLRIEGFIMKPCFNLVVKVWFSMSSGRAFQCQGMNAGPEVGGVSGVFGWFVSQIANLIGTTMLRSLVKATQGACQDEISSIQLIGLFGKCKGRLWVCLSLCARRRCSGSGSVTEKLKQSGFMNFSPEQTKRKTKSIPKANKKITRIEALAFVVTV